MGTLFGIKAFAVAILGGITSASGVMLAGLAYGLIEALVTAYLGSVYTQIVAFSVVILALAFMPNGLMGRAAVNKGLTMRIDAGRSVVPLAIVALTAAGLLLAAKSDGYTPFVLALVALTAVVGVGLNILLGLTGQVSLGHVGFYAIGAYTVAILTLKGVDFWIALPLAGAVAGIVGFVLALPALRVTGPYLAMVTIAFAFIVQHGTIEWRTLTGGSNGLDGHPAAVDRRTDRLPSARWRCLRSRSRAHRSTHSTASPAAAGAWRWWRCATPNPPRARSASIR